MRIDRSLIAAAGLALLLLPAGLRAQAESCVACHLSLEGELKAPAEKFPGDVHRQSGLRCRDCHGGNPAAADEDGAHDKTFKGAPRRTKIPEFCGGCHADAAAMRRSNPGLRVDQLEQYWTSRHGRLLKKGDAKAAICTDCHGSHSSQSSKYPRSSTFPWNVAATCGRCHSDPAYMKAYGIPVNQVDEYKESVHARALLVDKDFGAPTCNGCHGNHGAFPPDVRSVGAVCGRCHPSPGALFEKSPHKKAFDELGLSECEACHGHHKIGPPSNAMLGGGDRSVCLPCHKAGSAAGKISAEIRALLDGVEARSARAAALLARAEKKGVDVSQSRFQLREASTAEIGAVNLVHGLDAGEIRRKLAEGSGLLDQVDRQGEAALKEAVYRRRGLALSTALLALFALALYLKIRERNRRGTETQSPPD
jgi:predicted CXXCH cytochrome family protein